MIHLLFQSEGFIPYLPELVVLGTALILLMLGLFRGKYAFHRVMVLSRIALAAVLIMICAMPPSQAFAFHGCFISDAFAILMKALVVGAALLALTVSQKSLASDNIVSYEYPVLVLFATLGMMVMISASDLMSLFLGLELQSLSLYILVALPRDNPKASEAAVKYFVLGALSTCLVLYGSSFIYGYAGTVNFERLAAFLRTGQGEALPLKAGMAFLMAGLAFKISAVPFHMWTPDVYEGAPSSIITFIASAPKIAGFALIIRVFVVTLGELWPYWQALMVAISILSMVLGTFGALNQNNVKRLLAYSAISNMGYALIGIVMGTEEGITASILYMVIYLMMIAGIFTCLLNITYRNQGTDSIEDIKGLVRLYPGTSFALCFLLFSMAGIPPLAGFLGKMYIFQSAVSSQYYFLTLIGVLTSVVAAAYYLWLVKTILMDEPNLNEGSGAVRYYRREPAVNFALTGIIAGLAWIFIFPASLLKVASDAAASLFGF